MVPGERIELPTNGLALGAIEAPLAVLRAKVEGLMTLNATAEEQATVEAGVVGMRSFLAQLATDPAAKLPVLP